ncbi:MAG: serine hydrolase, partial [Rhodospirillaceae bacterium]|nr:serine hydrolase [Rhodospirillaceae bacterium]
IDDQLGNGEFEPPPWNEVLGPTKPRGGPAGFILRRGRLAAAWGDAGRADMTFSVAKSYLAILAGLAVMDGLIGDVNERVAESALDDHFSSAQNRDITWQHLLQQTSEWEGTLWDKPDLIDRHRQLGAGADNSRKGQHRDLAPPGEYWEYNDVRVNRLSLSLLHLFRRPLDEVLAERIMAPIGASTDWSWNAYRNAYVTIDGVRMPSVPGGSHWGGGLWIGAGDQAKLGQLILQHGAWDGRQLLTKAWVDAMLTPCAINPEYGYLWWLNTDRLRYPAASAGAAAAVGAGGNTILVDPAHDLVLVARWLDDAALNPLLEKTIAAITD